jgi:hypothetical protein
VQVTDERLEKETEIVYARNEAEDVEDEVARLKEWQKPELRTNSLAKVNMLTLSFKFREAVNYDQKFAPTPGFLRQD